MASEIEKLNRAIKRKRRKKIIRFTMLCIVLIIMGAVLTRIFFRAKMIYIDNSSIYPNDSIMNSIKKIENTPLLPLEKDVIAQELIAEYPYIKEVEISVSLPDKLKISFMEAKPVFSISTESGYLCVDADLKVLEETTLQSSATLLINGMTLEEYSVGKIIDREKNIEATLIDEIVFILKERDLYKRLTKIDFSKKYNIKFTLDNLIEVELGNSEFISEKIDMLIEILNRNPQNQKAVINVRDHTQGRYNAVD